MNTNLAPAYQKQFGEYWVLWYALSNSYSIVTSEFKTLLDTYIASESETDFLDQISNNFGATNDTKRLSETLFGYLKNCNIPYTLPKVSSTILDKSHRRISKRYCFDSKTIEIHYSSELVLKTIDPAIAHYSLSPQSEIDVSFDIYLKDEHLYLFKNEELIISVPKRSYHLIQGKFIMQLLCELHNKSEEDWIGTLHGSTITDGQTSMLFIGKSGKGKSTLCALLAAHGFDLLADDVSALLSKNQHIYHNPSAISIKEGAFKLFPSLVDCFEELPIIEFNTSKGQLKYIPYTKPENSHYPCSCIVLVNYTPESKTLLEPISIKEVLETLIEDSWLSHNPKHSQQFLNWLHHLKFYQLTYSNTTSVVKEISTLFKQEDNNL